MPTRTTPCRWIAATLAALWMCAGAAAQPANPCGQRRDPQAIASLTLVGVAELRRTPHSVSENLGGISGLDYDPASKRWYLLSDDRSRRAPARFYPTEIDVSAAGVGAVTVLPPVTLPVPAHEVPDPEALRRIPCTNRLAWASEGDRGHGVHPSVRWITPTGSPVGDVSLPENLTFSANDQSGPRDNLSVEGLAPTRDGKALWLSMEAPLIQDGPLPDLERGAVVRLARLPLDGGKARQLAYRVDPIPVAASGGRMRADNGVSELLTFGDEQLLVIERSGREIAPGEFAFDVRIYHASWAGADDVSDQHAITVHNVRTMQKRLLINLKSLGLPWIDNIEGAAWGPILADGRHTLVLVSDDNFAPKQVTQIIVLAVEAP